MCIWYLFVYKSITMSYDMNNNKAIKKLPSIQGVDIIRMLASLV